MSAFDPLQTLGAERYDGQYEKRWEERLKIGAKYNGENPKDA
jgi:hypothetical protein